MLGRGRCEERGAFVGWRDTGVLDVVVDSEGPRECLGWARMVAVL